MRREEAAEMALSKRSASGSRSRMARIADVSMITWAVPARRKADRRGLWKRSPWAEGPVRGSVGWQDGKPSCDILHFLDERLRVSLPLLPFQTLPESHGDGPGHRLAGELRQFTGQPACLLVLDVETHAAPLAEGRLSGFDSTIGSARQFTLDGTYAIQLSPLP